MGFPEHRPGQTRIGLSDHRCSVYVPAMATVRDQLIWKALLAVDEAAQRAANAPIAPSFALRFALAFLYAASGSRERWSYDSFWQEIQRPTPVDGRHCARKMMATTALHGIMRSVGVIPTLEATDRLRANRQRLSQVEIAARRLAKEVSDERLAPQPVKKRRRTG